MSRKNGRYWVVWFTIIGLVAACSRAEETVRPIFTPRELPASTAQAISPAPSDIPTALPMVIFTDTPIPSVTIIPSPTLRQTDPPTQTPIPTYTILRGTVIQRANCRYGAGWPYLYKYGLLIGNYLEILGRNEEGTWIQVRAIGGDNPCWVKADLLDIDGDVMSVAQAETKLPFSPYYGPLSGVWADRIGNEVLITWNPMRLRPGDESGQWQYLVEAWVCQAGDLLFTPVGTYENELRVLDEPGCSDESHARVYGVEKHGYTWWVEVPWPRHKSEGGWDPGK